MRIIRRSVIALTAVTALALPVTPVFAQYGEPSTQPSVDATIDREPRPGTTVQGSTITRGSDTGGLSVTGADVVMFGLIGAGTFFTGSALVIAGRRRRSTAE